REYPADSSVSTVLFHVLCFHPGCDVRRALGRPAAGPRAPPAPASFSACETSKCRSVTCRTSMRGCSELTDAPERPPCPPLRAAPDSSQVHAPGWAVRGDGARSGIWPGAELHGWPQNRNASPQAEPNPQFVSMDEDMAVWRRRLRLCAMIGTVLASWPKD